MQINKGVKISSGAWSPEDITTALWYDASDSDTITASGGSVSQLDDKSGNLNHATQGVAGNQPTTGVKTIGGLNTINFDNDFLVFNDLTLAETMVAIVYNPLAAVSQFMIASDGFGGAKSRFYIMEDGADFGNSEVNITDPTNDDTLTVSTVDGVGDGVNQAIYKNGTLGGSGTTDRSSVATNFELGGRLASLAEFDFCEVVIVYNDTTQSTRQKLEGYLAHKWSLTDELPADHPYKSNAPTA